MKKLIIAFVVLFVLVISFNATCAVLVFSQDDIIYLASNKTDDKIDTAESLYVKGSMLSLGGEFEEALHAFNKAIELDPNYKAAYLARAQLLAWDLGKWRLAIKNFSKLMEFEPEDIYNYLHRGECYEQLGNRDQAFRDYDKAIQVGPKNATAYEWRGNAYYRIGQYHEALKDYSKAIELSPEWGKVYYFRASTYQQLGQEQLGLEDCKTAARLGWEEAQDVLREAGIEW
jgi:tetratricopeptide (TPR) repeat protein